MRLAILTLIAAAVSEATIRVIRVTDGGFEPAVLEASEGDVLEFHFVKGLHSVVQTSLEKPCSFLSGGFASGTMFTPIEHTENKRVFHVEVSGSEPIWFYNGAYNRCHEDGHVGVVNPPSSSSYETLRASALRQRSTQEVSSMVGGKFLGLFQ